MSVNLGTAYASIDLNVAGFNKKMTEVNSQLTAFRTQSQLVSSGWKTAGAALTATGKALTVGVTMPIAAIGTAAVKTTATFDASMSKVQALTGATGKDFQTLRDLAIEMGGKTAFSASEAADALSYMGLAGWKTDQMIAGLPGVLNLAAASQMDLAEASDMVTDYLTAFGLEAEHATVMADQMSYAQANSNTTTRQLGEAFGNCASQMHTAGQSMETTTAFLEAMANQGLKGSEAGTALSAVMRDITQKMEDGSIAIGDTSVAVMDQNGNFRNLIDIMADVEKATEGMGTAEKSAALMQTFTARSIKAVSMSLTEGTDNLYAYESALHGVDGAAGDMADTMLNNLSGQLVILKSSIETLMIQIGDIITPYTKKLVENIRNLVVSFTELDEEHKKQIVKWAAIAASIGPVLLIVGKLVSGVGGLIAAGSKVYVWLESVATAFGIAGGAGGAFSTILSGIASAAAPILGVVAAVTALAVGFKKLYESGGQFTQVIDNLVESLHSGLTSAISSIQTGLNNLKNFIKPIIEMFKKSFDFSAIDGAMAQLVQAFMDLGEALKPVMKVVMDFAGVALKTSLAPMLLTIVGLINGVISALAPLIDVVTDIVKIVTDAVNVVAGLLKGLVTGDFTQFKKGASNLGKDIVKLLKDCIKTIVEFIKGFISGIVTTLDSFTKGTLTKIKEFFSNTWNTIKTFFTVTIPSAFNTFIHSTLPNFISSAKNFFDKLPENLGFAIGYALEKLRQWGVDMLTWATVAIPLVINNIVTFFTELPGKIQTWLTNTLQKIVTWGTNLASAAGKAAASFVNTFVGFVKELPGKVLNLIKTIPEKITSITGSMTKAGKDIMTALWNGLKSIWTSIANWFKGIGDKVKGFVNGIKDGMSAASSSSGNSHADGLAYVPYNGYKATLHEGERVLTRNEAKEYGNGKSGGSTFIFNSPKALDPYEANRLFRETVRQMEEGFV